MDAYIIIERRGVDQLGEGPTWSPSVHECIGWISSGKR